MSQGHHYQPRWGRVVGALLTVVILVALTRDTWEVAIGLVVIALLIGSYMVRRQARRHSVYAHDRRDR